MTTAAPARRIAGFLATPIAACKPMPDSGLRQLAWACLCAILISLPIFAIGGGIMYSDYSASEAERAEYFAQRQAYTRLVSGMALPELPTDRVIHGRTLFENNCSACHKPDGTGIDGLGKNLTQSWFVASRNDAELVTFITGGRAPSDPLNTTKVPMPPKGGHDELTDAELSDIVVFVRGIQDPRRLPALPPSTFGVAAAPTEEQKAQALAAAGGDAELAGYIAHGTTIFASTCSACHGKDAKGLPNLGKDLVHSTFCKGLDDDALLAFVKRGRDPSDPANTTRVGMPPRGGNPALSDDDLLDVISYVRSLQKQATN